MSTLVYERGVLKNVVIPTVAMTSMGSLTERCGEWDGEPIWKRLVASHYVCAGI
jgi:hypothetical protein